MKLAITKTGNVYHRYEPPEERDSDPLTTLLMGTTRCGHEVMLIVDENTRPSPISVHSSVGGAVQDGLYCGNCWR